MSRASEQPVRTMNPLKYLFFKSFVRMSIMNTELLLATIPTCGFAHAVIIIIVLHKLSGEVRMWPIGSKYIVLQLWHFPRVFIWESGKLAVASINAITMAAIGETFMVLPRATWSFMEISSWVRNFLLRNFNMAWNSYVCLYLRNLSIAIMITWYVKCCRFFILVCFLSFYLEFHLLIINCLRRCSCLG